MVENNQVKSFKFKLRDMDTLNVAEIKLNNRLEIATDNGECGQTLEFTGYDENGNVVTGSGEDAVTLIIKNASFLSGLPTTNGTHFDVVPSGRANLATVDVVIDESNDTLTLKNTLFNVSFYLNDVITAQNGFDGKGGIIAIKTGTVTFILSDDSNSVSGSASINIVE